MLEADALDRVGQLEVHREVIAVELERVFVAQAPILLDIHRQARHRAVERELPVDVFFGGRLERRNRLVGAVGRHGPQPNHSRRRVSRQYIAVDFKLTGSKLRTFSRRTQGPVRSVRAGMEATGSFWPSSERGSVRRAKAAS